MDLSNIFIKFSILVLYFNIKNRGFFLSDIHKIKIITLSTCYLVIYIVENYCSLIVVTYINEKKYILVIYSSTTRVYNDYIEIIYEKLQFW